MQGSGIFSKYMTLKHHLLVGPGGLAAEVQELATSLEASLAGLKAIFIEEWDAPPAASAAAVLASTASTNGTVTYTAVAGTVLNTAFTLAARNLVVTGGGTTSNCPTSAVIVGYDAGGNQQTETVALTSGSGTGVKGWSKVVSIEFLGGTGTAGTVEVGTGVKIGLSYGPKLRAGQTSPLLPEREIVDGAALSPSTGSIDTVNRTYTPAAAPNGTHKYAIQYEGIGL
jgi:hypothetical protein